jgi:hypothetical protein
VTAMPAPMADVDARLRDFALAILGGAPSRELEPGPAPPLAARRNITPPGVCIGKNGYVSAYDLKHTEDNSESALATGYS